MKGERAEGGENGGCENYEFPLSYGIANEAAGAGSGAPPNRRKREKRKFPWAIKMKAMTKEETIRQYIQAYNHFDVEAMLAGLHPDLEFQNISNGGTTARTTGKSEFEALARQTVSFFKTRSQSLRSLRISGEKAVAEIDFSAVLKRDIPGGPRAGEKIELQGTSEFLFKDGLIRSIIDKS